MNARVGVAQLAAMGPMERAAAMKGLNAAQVGRLLEHWDAWALDGQRAPPGDWRVWLIRAGRGFGKTRAGAEWISQFARDHPEGRIALVGGTREDVQRVMVEGESGLVSVAHAGEAPRWRPTAGELRFASGAIGFVYSAGSPEALRGPQHHAAWCDELAKWRYGDIAWDNLVMGMRLGDQPRIVVTTTPRPTNLMRRVMVERGMVETRGRTDDNPHLPQAFRDAMRAYAGTRLGRQELDGELIDDVADALWTRARLEGWRVRVHPPVRRVVVAVDPPAGIGGDACGIVAVALCDDSRAYVLDDASVEGLAPEGWARAVAACAARHGADRVVAEANQGGAMVRSVLHAADGTLPLKLVHAAHGKVARAEPVAMLYDNDRVRHVGVFPRLEDELCGLVPGGVYAGPGRSPDRADALVWAMTALMLERRVAATVRPIG